MADDYYKGPKAFFATWSRDQEGNDNRPSRTGQGTISKEVLKVMFSTLEENPNLEELHFEVASWDKTPKGGGTEYCSISIEMNEGGLPRTKKSGTKPPF